MCAWKKSSSSQHYAHATQTIKNFCSVNFSLFWGPAHSTSRDFMYSLGKKIFSTLRDNSQLQGKILKSAENSQFSRKFSTLEKILISGKNSEINFKENSQIRWKKYYNYQENIMRIFAPHLMSRMHMKTFL